MRLVPLLATIVALHGSLSAQDDIRLFHPSSTATGQGMEQNTAAAGPANLQKPAPVVPGTVKVTESDRIQALMAGYAAHKRPLEGYRVQVFIGDRAQAEATRRAFLVQHPDIPAYLSYLAPNFRVRIGDLRDRVDAENMREALRGEFPGLYVVPDQIEPPRLPDQLR